MFTSLRRQGIAALIALISITDQGSASEREKVVIGVQDFENYLPYSSYRDFNYQGFNRELLDLFGQFANLELEYRPMPIPRLYQALIDGEIDARYPDNPEWVLQQKPLDITYSKPLVAYIDGALVKPENLGRHLIQLSSLAIIRGYTPVHSYQKRHKAGHLKWLETNGVSPLLEQVVNDKAEAGYVNIAVAMHQLSYNTNNAKSLVFDPNLPYKRSFRYLSSRTNPQLIERFNQFLEAQAKEIQTLKVAHRITGIPSDPLPKQLHLTTHNLPPYGSYPENKTDLSDQDFTGAAVDVVRCALKQLNVKLDITVTPWRRAQAMVVNAAADGFFAASQNSQDRKSVV